MEDAPGCQDEAVAATDERFGKQLRIRTRRDFLRVQREGRRFHTKRLTILSAPSRVGHTRVGLTVSRKVGNAVTRARVKRKLREIFRRNKDRWPPNTEFVIVARPRAADATYDSLRDDLYEWARYEQRQARRGEG